MANPHPSTTCDATSAFRAPHPSIQGTPPHAAPSLCTQLSVVCHCTMDTLSAELAHPHPAQYLPPSPFLGVGEAILYWFAFR